MTQKRGSMAQRNVNCGQGGPEHLRGSEILTPDLENWCCLQKVSGQRKEVRGRGCSLAWYTHA